MNTEKPVINNISVKIELSKDEKIQAKRYAKRYAKRHGYSFQWWFGSLVKKL